MIPGTYIDSGTLRKIIATKRAEQKVKREKLEREVRELSRALGSE